MFYSLPALDIEALALSEADKVIARGILSTRGESKGLLRTSKPKIAYTKAGHRHVPDMAQGCTAYVWRHVAFNLSPVPQHQCMPCTADFSLPVAWGTPEYKALVARLDAIVDVIVNSVPKSEWHGVRRWGRALGMTA